MLRSWTTLPQCDTHRLLFFIFPTVDSEDVTPRRRSLEAYLDHSID
jgi:hypothetical protein